MFGDETTIAIIQGLQIVKTLLLLVAAAVATSGYRRTERGFLGVVAAGLVLLALPGLITAVYNWWVVGPGRPTTPESGANSVYLTNAVVLSTQIIGLAGYLLLGVAGFMVARRPARRRHPHAPAGGRDGG